MEVDIAHTFGPEFLPSSCGCGKTKATRFACHCPAEHWHPHLTDDICTTQHHLPLPTLNHIPKRRNSTKLSLFCSHHVEWNHNKPSPVVPHYLWSCQCQLKCFQHLQFSRGLLKSPKCNLDTLSATKAVLKQLP